VWDGVVDYVGWEDWRCGEAGAGDGLEIDGTKT